MIISSKHIDTVNLELRRVGFILLCSAVEAKQPGVDACGDWLFPTVVF